MATYNKFNLFTQDVNAGVYNFTASTDVFKVMLTNTLPVATNHVYADVSAGEVANGGGYTTGGATTTVSKSNASGVETIAATDVTFTATTGFGPFQYVIVYDTTPTVPLKPLICWFDFGSPVTLAAGDTFQVVFNASGLFTLT